MTEHTAGPWRAEICPDIAHEYPAWVICADASPYKAGFAHFDGKDAGFNALLAAAAPALLAAAEAFVAINECSCPTPQDMPYDDDLDFVWVEWIKLNRCHWHKARAAISQARGEA